MTGLATRSVASCTMGWSIADVLAATGAEPRGPCPGDLRFETVSTDSRQTEPGALFVALRGPRYDGHEFVDDALARGAAAALVERPAGAAAPERQLRVPDTLRALGDLAAWTRRRWGGRVVAVTGSNGKTTTKELAAAVCAAGHPRPGAVLKTEGNLNNLVGMPLTVLRLRAEHAIAVLELGMNRFGEIARMTEIGRPDYGLITNVGPVHLEGVGGTIEGVAAAKGELFAGLAPGAVMIVNVDDERVRRLAAPWPNPKVTFGRAGEVSARDIRPDGLEGMTFTLAIGARQVSVRLSLVGRHNVDNAVAAAAVGHALGVAPEEIVAGLERVRPVAMRLTVLHLANGVTLVNDAYNANPASVEAAFQALQGLPGRAVAVVGEMRELGDEARRAHRQVGERAGTLGLGHLVAVGALADEVAAGALAGGMPASRVHVCRSNEEAAAVVRALWRPGDTVLVKGSRAARMEEVVRLLEAAPGEP